MTEKLLSIIIPTYNMEALLPQCLDSLLVKEGKEKLDVLVVNDGSKDRSSKIAHQYADKYPETFRVIDKENGNYGSCINAALPLIRGKYVKILDADDSYETKNLEDYLLLLYKLDVDLVLTDFINANANGRTLKRQKYELPAKETIEFSSIDYHTYMAMHSVTYNVKVFENLNYHQTEGISYTDMEWVYFPMTNVKSVYYYDTIIYRYLIGRDGQTADYENRIKRISHIEKGLFNQLEFLKNIETSNMAYPYLNFRLQERIKAIYMMSLTNKTNYDLKAFDSKLAVYPSYYDYADTVCINTNNSGKQIPIVKIWRKYKSKLGLFLSSSYISYRATNFIKRL